VTDGACLHCRQKTLGLYIGWQKTRHSLGVGTVQDIMKRMPNFLLPIFRLPFFSWSFSFFVILNSNFSVALLFLPSQFSLRVYPLHNFPLPIFSDAVSVSFISYINFVLPCIPTLLFFVADFSGCPIFRLPFLALPFFSSCAIYRCRFCRESRLDLGRSHGLS